MRVKMLDLILLALIVGRSTTYGYGEFYCGNPGKPKACETGRPTQSGEIFDTNKLSMAIPHPHNRWVKAQTMGLMGVDGTCKPVRLNDIKNQRYIGHKYGGFDLSPAALRHVNGKAYGRWTGFVRLCRPDHVQLAPDNYFDAPERDLTPCEAAISELGEGNEFYPHDKSISNVRYRTDVRGKTIDLMFTPLYNPMIAKWKYVFSCTSRGVQLHAYAHTFTKV